MPRAEMVHQEKFVFKYTGDLEYIDFDTLYVSQLHFTEFIKAIKAELIAEGTLNIKVKALPPGSFPIELAFDIKETAETIYPIAAAVTAAIAGVGGFISAAESIIKFFKWLGGRKIAKEEKKGDITIVYIDESRTFEINTIIFEAIKNNPEIRRQLARTFEKISADDEVTGIKIESESGENIAEVPRSEFQSFDSANINSIAEKLNEAKVITEENVPLSIFKIVFEKGFKWQFVYKGHRISASINDNDFLKDVTNGSIRFASGDVLYCNMDIHQSYDPIVDTYVNDSYVIQQVIKHIPRAEQSKMFS